MKTPVDFEVVVHGVDHEQYFQGCGVSFTPFSDVATGIGDNAPGAYGDALEMLATGGWDVSKLPSRPCGVNAKLRVKRSDGDEAHVYVSVRVR